MQLDLLSLQGETQGVATIEWIPIELLQPHPDNPRLIYREDIIETIAQSITENGFNPCYALLVRPLGTQYQIISGHTRHKAAIKAGCKMLPCWVKDIDDEAAFMELVLANNQGELSPLEYGIHVLKYVELSEGGRGKKGGLSEYAKLIGKSKQTLSDNKQAATVFNKLSGQPDSLLDKANHLYHIHKAPDRYWQQLTELLLKRSWSVKETEAIVNAVKELEIPENLQELFKPNECIEKIGADVVKSGETRYAKDINNFVKAITDSIESLNEKREIKIVEGDKYSVAYWNLKEMYLEKVLGTKLPANPTSGFFTKIATTLLKEVQAKDEEFTTWEQTRLSDQEKKRLEERRQIWLKEMQEKYSPTGHQGDVRDILPTLKQEYFDCILTDPPYLLSNGGITCRGNKQVSVDKNFEDSKETAIAPHEWLTLCYPLLKPGGVVVLTCTIHLLVEAMQALEDVGFEFLHEYIWYKKSAPPRLTPTGPRACHEYVLVARKPGATHCYNYDLVKDKYHEGKQPSSVLEFEQCSGTERLKWHDTQKPLDLWTYLLDLYTKPYISQVLDLFSGSGTTAVACKQTARFCHWVEKDPEFFRLSLSRIEGTSLPFKPEEMDFADNQTEGEPCDN